MAVCAGDESGATGAAIVAEGIEEQGARSARCRRMAGHAACAQDDPPRRLRAAGNGAQHQCGDRARARCARRATGCC